MNSNLVHNVLNVLIAISGLGAALLLAFGCVDVAGTYDCSKAVISPTWLGLAAGMLGALKTIINIGRDGFGGLVKPQPPVADNIKTVVVATPADATVEVKRTK
jgi:hypothetical protein